MCSHLFEQDAQGDLAWNHTVNQSHLSDEYDAL